MAHPKSHPHNARLGGIMMVTLALIATACGGGDAAESAVVLETSSTLPTASTAAASTDDSVVESPADSVSASTTSSTPETTLVEDTAPTTTARQAGQGATLTDSARVSTLGLGPVYMGDTLDEVADKIGVDLDPEDLGDETCRYYVALGGPPGVSFVIAFGRVARVDIEDPSIITTRSGAGIGSTREEIVGLFGDKIVASPHPYSDGEYLTFVPIDEKDSNLRIIFETNSEGVVTAFRTGQLPEVEFIEGCA